jgi:hypothetical protein
MPNENWWERSKVSATAIMFILTKMRHPKRVIINPTVTGHRAGSVIEVLSFGCF